MLLTRHRKETFVHKPWTIGRMAGQGGRKHRLKAKTVRVSVYDKCR